MQKLLLTVTEAGELLGFKRAGMYNLIKRTGLPVVRPTGQILIPYQALEKWIESLVTGVNSIKPACKDCKYCRLRITINGPSEEEDRPEWICMRHAPRPGSLQNMDSGSCISYEVLWPAVLEDDWCGEFEPREADQEAAS